MIKATNNFQSKSQYNRSRHQERTSSVMPELSNFGTLIFGILIGVFATSLVVFLLSPNDITLKLPTSNANTDKTSQDVDVLAAENTALAPIAMQEPRFDFYSELTKAIPENTPAPTNIVIKDLKSVPATINSYIVQAGIYKKNADADAIKAKLTLNGFNAKIESIRLVDGEIRHRIILGPLKTEKHAQSLQQQLKAIDVDSIVKVL